MFKKTFVLVLVVLLLNMVGISPVRAASAAEKTSKIKAGIAKLGTGEAARVELRLTDNSKLKGYIREATDENFVVVDANGNAKAVGYPQVKSVKGNNLAKGVKIALFLGFLVGVVLVLPILILKSEGDRG